MFALAVGWICGGKVGIGTIISVFFIGYVLQIVFKLVKFDATKIKNESLIETAKNIKNVSFFSFFQLQNIFYMLFY
jgi:uncharacterized membrane protein YczE